MTLVLGSRLGPYEILAAIGAGGMGQVYRARDTKLGRDIALKILPDSFTNDPERLARFRREAQVLASLNHPHIGAIYGFDEADGTQFLVLELVDGGNLDDRIKRGPPPVDETLSIAKQIAEALEAAHEKGIIHRDLKPANIALTKDGQVKVVDFGLARAVEPSDSSGDLSHSPTVTSPAMMSGLGVVLGTAAYMSPEQAKGRPANRRSDVWAFGCVLFELLTGKRAFQGETFSDTVASILAREPDWQILPAATPAKIRELLRRCLRKDATRRLQDIGDARIMIEEAFEEAEPTDVAVPKRRSLRIFFLAIAFGGGMAALVLAFWPIPVPQSAALVPFATESDVQTMARWSPQGDRIAYVAAVDSVLQVFTKSPGSSVATQITHEKQGCLNPMWSPDGARLYYLTGTKSNGSVRSIAVAGGPSEKVLDHVLKADLSPDGKTMAALVSDSGGRYRLALSSPPGAAPQPYSRASFSELMSSGAATYLHFSPSGKDVGLLTLGARAEFWKIPVDGRPAVEMLHGIGGLRIGHFTWLTRGAGIVTDVTGSAQEDLHLWLVGWSSNVTWPITGGVTRDSFPSLSPDGRTLAFSSGELGFDIIEVAVDGSAAHDVVATSRQEIAPAWAPDGVHFAYITDRSGGAPEIWLRNRLDGSERRLVGSKELPEAVYLQDCAISPDGTRVAYRVHAKDGDIAIWISPLNGDLPVKLWNDPTKSPQRGPSWSPDGSWVAYSGFHDGKTAVMKIRVGANGPGEFVTDMSTVYMVRWSPHGEWIVFRDGDTLRIVSPDGTQNRLISHRPWDTYGWSTDGTALYGIASGENHRLMLGQIDVATGKGREIADLGPIPPAFDLADDFNEFRYRGFSLHPNGKSFLVSMLRARQQIYLMKDFDRTVQGADRWWSRW